MGRAGSGSGRRFSSGDGHSFRRSSGGHSLSSRRAGSSQSSSLHSSRSVSHNYTTQHYYCHSHHGNGGIGIYVDSSVEKSYKPLITIGIVIMVSLCISVFLWYNENAGGKFASTIERTKIEAGNAFINDCIEDEIGWFDNIPKTEARLKDFWEATGVQPYIILKAYDPMLSTYSDKEQWAENYYDSNFKTENVFLYVYFAEEDTDNVVGYMSYVNGLQTSSVMDSEAVEIFWNYIDNYWYSDMSTDSMFLTVFDKTAETIMHVSTTSSDITKWLIIFVVVTVVGFVVVIIMKAKHKRAKEKAEEDVRILNTPLDDMVTDSLADKYQ